MTPVFVNKKYEARIRLYILKVSRTNPQFGEACARGYLSLCGSIGRRASVERTVQKAGGHSSSSFSVGAVFDRREGSGSRILWLHVHSWSIAVEAVEMGIFKSSFSFMLGTVCGVYIAQNYNVPNIRKLVNTGIVMAKHIEESYRKPKKKDDD